MYLYTYNIVYISYIIKRYKYINVISNLYVFSILFQINSKQSTIWTVDFERDFHMLQPIG